MIGSNVDLDSFGLADDDLPSTYERESVLASRADPVIFLEYVLGWKCKPCHEEWQEYCSEHSRLVLFAPTEHGKSSQISFGRTTWELGKSPNLRVVLASSSADNSKKNVGLVKQAISLNPRLKQVFPWLRKERRNGREQAWGKDAIIIERDDLTNKDYSLQALGLMGTIIGSRVDLLILDDVLDFDNTLHTMSRQRTIDWYKSSAVSRLTPNGRAWCIGTAWHVQDVMHWMEENKKYFCARYDADDMLWPESEVVAGKVVGWPKLRLEERLAEVGEVEYARQMKNMALSDVMRIFSESAIDECMELDGRTTFDQGYSGTYRTVVTGIDLAVKKGEEHDETVMFTASIGPDGLYVLHDISAARTELPGILRKIISVYQRFGSLIFKVENNAAQDYVLQVIRNPDEFFEAIGAKVPDTILKQIRVEPFTTGMQKYDPTVGVRSMTVDFEQRKWRIPDTEETRKWIREMIRWTPSVKMGDRLAASWFCWSTLRTFAKQAKPLAITVGGGNQDGRASVKRRPPSRFRFKHEGY